MTAALARPSSIRSDAIAANPALQARFDILVSIPGVGAATAFAIW